VSACGWTLARTASTYSRHVLPLAASPRPSPLRQLGGRSLALDVSIAVVLTAFLVFHGYIFAALPQTGAPAATALTWVSGVAMCLALAVRRIVPLTVLVVVAVAFSVYGFSGGLDVFGSNIALFLATVTAGSHGRAPARDRVRAVVIAGLFGTVFYAIARPGTVDAGLYALLAGQVYAVALNVFYFLAAWVLGDQIRLRHQREAELTARTAELAARTAELEQERERTAEQAATAERLRLARELHDVLGHHVSVVGVQAAAAGRIVHRDPDRAAVALTSIEHASRQAVSELQRVLRLLRSDEGTGPGGLAVRARLDALARELRGAGLEVTCQVQGLETLPTEIDLAVGRVVQEALTNVLRHAGPGTSAWVRLVGHDDRVEVEVVDDARGTPVPGTGEVGSGSGLTGMRERVELHGGRFSAGPVSPRGFRVRAELPLPAVEPAAMWGEVAP
jgi:signal transduction histidine kinase